jgi:hypothetical protein
MQVRQRRRTHHGKGGLFEPAFKNVGLRIHVRKYEGRGYQTDCL